MLSFSGSSRSVSVNLTAGFWSYDVTKIMPLGDSITSGFNSPPNGAYRAPLWDLLAQSGRAIDFVGGFEDGPASLPDRNHQGSNAQKADELIPLVPDLMAQYQPDIVLLMIGSNDVGDAGEEPSTLTPEITQILDLIAAQLPRTSILVSTLTPLDDKQLNYSAIPEANDAIRAAVSAATGKGQHVALVEPNLTLSDLVDGVHPNTTGSEKLAQAWYASILAEALSVDPAERNVTGGEANDSIVGSAVSNWLAGQGGNDIVNGQGGNDQLFGGSGTDTMYGGSGNDRLYGGSAGDLVYGGSGADRLYGGDGTDLIVGGTGRDLLQGGAGRDKFVFKGKSDSGLKSATRDVVLDFRAGDKLDLSAVDASTKASGNNTFKLVSDFSGKAGQLQWDKTSTGFIVSGDVNGNGSADFSIQLKTSIAKLHSWDFAL